MQKCVALVLCLETFLRLQKNENYVWISLCEINECLSTGPKHSVKTVFSAVKLSAHSVVTGLALTLELRSVGVSLAVDVSVWSERQHRL